MSADSIVIGGGMTGIVSAYLLAKGGRKVTLLEPRPTIGGVNTGREWEGFCLDFGCHLFGNESDASTAVLLELMEGEVVPVHVHFASILNGRRTDGFELPALDSLGAEVASQIVHELIQAAAEPNPRPPKTLEEFLVARYGKTAAAALDVCLRKALRVSSKELAPEAIAATTFRRIRIVSDSAADLLKQIPALDERIARGSAEDPMRFYRSKVRAFPHRSFYPSSRGMLGFSERARNKLSALGVRIITGVQPTSLDLGAQITVSAGEHRFHAGEAIWTLGLGRLEPLIGTTSGLAEAGYTVPMVLYYFDIDKSQETGMSYVNSFDAQDLVFRASVPGSYGPDTCPPGRSYVCCEVPTSLDSPEWNDPEAAQDRVWVEAVRFGVATGHPRRALIQKASASYKAPRAEFFEKSAMLTARLDRQSQLIVPPEWSFSTTRTILELIPKLRGETAA